MTCDLFENPVRVLKTHGRMSMIGVVDLKRVA